MAKKEGLKFKDLIAAQRRLAAQGDARAAEQVQILEAMQANFESEGAASISVDNTPPGPQPTGSVEKLTQQVEDLNKTTEENSPEIVNRLESLETISKKGLVDKTGDGLNSNVIRMTKELREALSSKKQKSADQPSAEGQRVERESKQSAARYAPGFRDVFNKETFFKQEEGARLEREAKTGALKYKPGAKDKVQSIKDTFSVKGIFDLSEGKSQGLIGDLLRKREARKEFVEQRMATNPDEIPEGVQKGKTDKETKRNVRKYYEEVFKNTQEVQREQKINEEKIEKLKKSGYSEEEIGKAGLLKTRQELDDKMAAADPRYAKQREKERAGIQERGEEKKQGAPESRPKLTVVPSTTPDAAGIPTQAAPQATSPQTGMPIPAGFTDGIAAPSIETASSLETETENLRMMEEQNQVLSSIEENTRPLKDLGDVFTKLNDSFTKMAENAKAGGGGGGGDDGGGGGLLDMLRGRRGPKVPGKPGIFSKAGGLLKKGVGAASSLIGGVGLGTTAAVTAAAVAAGTAGYSAYKFAKGEDASNWISNLAGVDKWDIGGPDEEEMASMDKEAVQKSYDKRIAAGEKLDPKLAEYYRKAGVEVDPAVVQEGATPGAPSAVQGTETEVPEGAEPIVVNGEPVGYKDQDGQLVPLKGKETQFKEAQQKTRDMMQGKVTQQPPAGTPLPPSATPATPAVPAPVGNLTPATPAGPSDASAAEIPEGASPITYNGEPVGYMDQDGNKVPLEGKEEQLKAAVTGVQTTMAGAVTPRAADNVYAKSGENAAASQQSQGPAPVIVNAPQNITSTNTTSYSSKKDARNIDSSYKDYIRSRFA